MKKFALGILVMLLATGITFAQVDRSKLPASGPAPEIKIGEAESFTLANGLKVFVVKNNKLPRVSFTLVLDRDPILEGEKQIKEYLDPDLKITTRFNAIQYNGNFVNNCFR